MRIPEIGRRDHTAYYVKLSGYRHLTGRDGAICDFTGQPVNAADFDFISPWEIRDGAYRGFVEYISERMDSDSTIAAVTIARNWSYWLTSKAIARELRSRFGLTP